MTVRTRARKVKKRLGPRLNKAIWGVLIDGVCCDISLQYILIGPYRSDSDILTLNKDVRLVTFQYTCQRGDVTSALLTVPERSSTHNFDFFRRYTHKTTAVAVQAHVSTAKTRNEVSASHWLVNGCVPVHVQLRQENQELRTELLKMEIRLARANSIIDIENGDHVEVVTGAPAAITEKVGVQRRQRSHLTNLQARLNASLRFQKSEKIRCADIPSIRIISNPKSDFGHARGRAVPNQGVTQRLF